jgi:hypothetical protein
MAEKKLQLKSNPLVTKLRQASKGDSVVELTGYLDASEDGVVRLFDDLSFESYVELRSADVIEVMESPREGVNRHRVFVPGSAHVRRAAGVSSRADALGGGGSIPPLGGGSPGGSVARWADFGYLETSSELRRTIWGGWACRRAYDRRISAIEDWIDVLEGINEDGRFDDLIENLRGQVSGLVTGKNSYC